LQPAANVRIPILAALLSLASAGCLFDDLVATDDGDECFDHVARQLRVEPKDPPLQFQMESCRVDVDACSQLCSLALSRMNVSATIDSCKVTFADDHATLFVRYATFNSDGNCAFVDDVAAGSPR
jgi:hypothetical protein